MILNTIASGSIIYSIATVKSDRELTKDIQQRLTNLGFAPGPIDGLWGNKTQSAFEAFAKKNQLSTDEVGPKAALLLLPQPAPTSSTAPKNNSPAPATPTTPAPTKPATQAPAPTSNSTNNAPKSSSPTAATPPASTPATPPASAPAANTPPSQPAASPKPPTNTAPTSSTPTPAPTQPSTPTTPAPSKPATPTQPPSSTVPPKSAPSTPPIATPQPLPANLREIANGSTSWQIDRISADFNLSKEVQQCLDALGHGLGPIDGLWGAGTQGAYNDCAKMYQFKSTELSPQTALFLLEPSVPGIPVTRPIKRLNSDDYRQVAKSIGCSVAAVRAVAEVEAAGSGFFRDGRPKILFEAHWFSDFTYGRYDRGFGEISSAVWNRDLYIGGAGEWDRLYKAMCLNREAALKSASWGLGQVMGFNHRAAGYSDVETFIRDMHDSEGKQLAAMFNFIKFNKLDRYLINLDWASFAYHYNGESYWQNRYDEQLADAHSYWMSAA